MSIAPPAAESDAEIKKMLINIQNVTVQMSNTFEQAILKHEEQFIKTYRIKINELTKLFQDLTQILEDKFINNALTNRLNIVQKERDYFKYECLKLNVQYQTVLNEQAGLTGHIASITDQMKIYKHLLEDEKLKNKELQKNAEKYKASFNEMAYKTLAQTIELTSPKAFSEQRNGEGRSKKLGLVLTELQEKNQVIRNLKIKVSELEMVANQKQIKYTEKKQLYDTFKACVNAWRRDIITKDRKGTSSMECLKRTTWDAEKLSVATKKDLLRMFFTDAQFLKFIEQLLFDDSFKVEFTKINEQGQDYMLENRQKLFDYMHKKRIIGSPNLLQR